jgi:hypothetical protein
MFICDKQDFLQNEWLWIQAYSKDFSTDIFLSCFTDVPSPPGRPSILEKSSRTAKISWSPSQTDNNSPIMHYSVNVM